MTLTLLASDFWTNTDHAKVCFVLAWLILWFLGFGIIVFLRAKLGTYWWIGALALIGLGLVPLGLLFGTP